MLLGIDIGTSGVKAALVHPERGVVREHLEPHDILTPKPGWAEQNPETWLEKACQATRAVLKNETTNAQTIDAVAFSGQMHGTAMLDANGKPIRPAIIWADARSDTEIREAMETVGEAHFHKRTLNRLAAGFGLASLLWIKNHEPTTFAKIRHTLCPKDYVRYRLCGELTQETSDASATCCMDTAQGSWATDILDKLGIPANIFPPLGTSTELAGRVTAEGAAISSLPQGTPLYFGGADQGVASIGAGITRPGIFGSNIGTGGQVTTCLSAPLHDAQYRTSTFLHAIPDRWTMYGAILAAGLSLKWLRTTFFPAMSFAEMSALAAQATPGCDGLLFLPHLAGERTPYFDPHARGTFWGMTLRHGAPEFIRAVMEGVGFAMRQCFNIMVESGAAPEKIIALGGGAKSPIWTQIQADMYAMPVETLPKNSGGDACTGCAILAGVGHGIYKSVEEASSALSAERGRGQIFDPAPAAQRIYAQQAEVFSELYHQLKLIPKFPLTSR